MRRSGLVCYLLFAICYSGLDLATTEAGDILRGNTGGSNSSPATSTFFGGNQAAMSQLQKNANDILTRAAQAMKSVQAMQQAARNAALQANSNVPNGLITGGLQIATGKNAEWKGANLPSQSVAGGQTTVSIQQTTAQAILNWQTFNVGKNTTVDFNQSAGGSVANTWVALNRILDPSGKPSQILGSIKAQGQVYLINQNGVIFGGASQINVSSLVAAAAQITDTQFTTNGIYSPVAQGNVTPSFTGGSGAVIVNAGAQIVTNAPLRTADRGGSVILLGGSVENDGSITTNNGQTVLAAGKEFDLLPGYSVTSANGSSSNNLTGNLTSTTLGTEVAVTNGGIALNTGLIQARTGDITMVGHEITQAGVVISSSSVDQRGTIHLLTDTTDTKASVTLAPGSITYIEPDPNSGTALDPQRTNAYQEGTAYLTATHLNDFALLPDRIGLSRIEITTGGTVDFSSGSLTSATAGQIEVSAGKRIFSEKGAELDVSGLVNVSLPMSANNLAVNIQGFEQRDDPLNRDTKLLNNNTVYVDLRELQEVPANPSYNAPYNTENRFYTPGGVLEVSGELNNVGHSIDEWDTVGGSITLSANQVVAQTGSVFDIAGGSIKYQAGYIKQSYLIASDGRIYNVNTAPAGITYTGVFNGFTVNHPRWNVTETYQNVITQPSQIYQAGYVEGRDAGSLTVNAATSIFEGTIDAKTIDGPQQNSVRPANVTDPFLLTQSTVTLNGILDVGPYGQGTSSEGPFYSSNIVFSNSSASLTSNLTSTSSINRSLSNTNTFSASQINGADLGGLTVDVQAAPKSSPSANSEQGSSTNSADAGSSRKHQGKGYLLIEAPLVFADGAQISLTAANVVIDGGIIAPDGNVTIDAVSYAFGETASKRAKSIAGITLESGAIIDTQGLWTNALLDPSTITGEAYINGGNVTLSSNQGITLATGSLIDASSGAAVLPNRKTLDGTGGNITIEADQVGNVTPPSEHLLTVSQAISRGRLILDGTLRSYGVKAGGALILQAYSVVIGDGVAPATASQLVLPTSFFSQGFSSYTIHGMESVTVEPGATIKVTEPAYQFSPTSFTVATGASITTALGSPLLMPVYVGNPNTAVVTQRPGASFSILAGVDQQTATPPKIGAGGTINIGTGSIIDVDPGQSINLKGADQITVEGTLRAPSGSIQIVNYRPLGGTLGHGKTLSYDPGGLSIWIGSTATLDVAARAFVTFDRFGRPYGVVPNGGSILLGSAGGTQTVDTIVTEQTSTDAFVIIRPGALLDASGTSAVLDLNAGANPTQNMITPVATPFASDQVHVSSNGGFISMSSYDGLYIDGTLRAEAGGPGGAGGTLSITFAGPIYSAVGSQQDQGVPNGLRLPRSIVIGQDAVLSTLPATLRPGQANPHLIVGQAYVSANAMEEGGFANLCFDAANSIVFDGNVNLKAAESISLTTTSIADTSRHGQVEIIAPYVLMSAAITAQTNANGIKGYGIVDTSDTIVTPFTNTPATQAVHGNAILTVEADLIDLQYTAFGDEETVPFINVTNQPTINYSAFKVVNFVSQGDIRFLSEPNVPTLAITTPGSFTFTAAQLYPGSGANVEVEAGSLFGNLSSFAPHSSISIYRINGIDPGVPQSAFGQLTLVAETINQGGIIRAPLGAITLGINKTVLSAATEQVNFLSGSITSVSANGLTIPYGGTTDGVTYTVDGQSFTTQNAIAAFSSSRGITVEGDSVSVAKGALLDLSGGGTLFGEGFISGRGGSLDVLSTALANQNPTNTFSAPGNTVYALVPGVQTYASAVVDTSTGFTGSMPGIGQQITVPAGVPGLPAGTYTLIPSNYALLPGAFRVELGGRGNTNQPSVLSLQNGSYEVNVNLGIANTGTRNALPTEAIITPASVVETYSNYDLETYSAVAISQAQKFNQPRPVLPIDGSELTLDLGTPTHRISQLTFEGTADFSPGSGGYSGALVIGGTSGGTNIEITGPGETPTKGWTSFSASAVDAIGAPNIYIGGSLVLGANTSSTAQTGTFLIGFRAFSSTQESVAIRTGAVLTAADVFLIAGGSGSITIESGASIDTLGRGAPAFDSTNGYFLTNQVLNGTSPQISSVLAVSNGYLNILPASGSSSTPITVNDGASLFSDGTIAFATNVLNLGENVNFGARYIGFSASDINIGTVAALAAAQRMQTLPPGILLNQTVLDQLLAGDPAVGAPALQILTISASQSINFYGSVDLNTINPVTGKSTLQDLVFDTPAVYGSGGASDVVTITTGTLVWNGLAQIGLAAGSSFIATYTDTPAGPVIPNGPGTGSGTFDIFANEIVFGYSPMDRPQNLTSLGRLVLGFSTVNLTASQEITANSKGTLSVYQTETGPGTYTGGNLNLIAPMLTGAPDSVLSYKTGGVLTLSPPTGVQPVTTMSDSLGAEINLNGETITISGSILAASGKVTLTATGDINLNANSRIDVSGLTVSMFDQKVPTFGGDVSLESTQGNITQDALSVINVSAVGDNAGSLTITATGASAGIVALGGTILGSSTGDFNAGSFDIRAQNPGDFATLNQLLDTGGFFWSRSFDIKQGSIDIAAGTTITAHTVTISVDNGSLTIGGTINASGTTPGTIRLSASGNLELQPTGVLDVHSTTLVVDSYGQPIYAENQGTIELTVADQTSVSSLNNGTGTLILDAGAIINMSSPDGIDRGDLELNAPRTAVTSGDIRIQASGPLNITGAQTIAVNAFWTYAPTDGNGTIVQSTGTGVPAGAVILDQVDQDSMAFIASAEPGGALSANLRGKLAGLLPYTQALHLRPGVEIVSDTPNGNLTVVGDLDLSKYRYASINPNSPLIANFYGSGEPGVLVLRAGGDLNIYGSINDGFAPLNLNGTASYPDETGWVLLSGIQTVSNVVIENAKGVTLASGTTFPNSSVALNYAIPIGTGTLKPNIVIPVSVTLSAAETVNVPFIAKADITIPGGQVFHAGQTVPAGTQLPIGTTLASGSVVPVSVSFNQPISWPAGAVLSDFTAPISLTASVPLNPGALIPAGTTPSNSVDTRSIVNGIQGQIYALEPLLSLGTNGQVPLSWSIRLVAGADTSAADTRLLQASSTLNGTGNLVLDDPHYSLASKTPILSVIRTGTGYLDLLAGGNFTEASLYGVYTAGAQTATITNSNGGSFDLPRGTFDGTTVLGTRYKGYTKFGAIYEFIASNDYHAYYPDDGGNVFVSAQGNITGFSTNDPNSVSSYNVSNWLWTQGGAGLGQNAAWWINFGTYVVGPNLVPVITGFTGIGALGGGNVIVQAGGNAGVTTLSPDGVTSSSLVIAVASTGRVTSLNGTGGGTLVETGGGDVTIKIGEALNPAAAVYNVSTDPGLGGGEFVDLRGKLSIQAGSIGGIDLVYGQSSSTDPRPTSISTAAVFSIAFGGPDVVAGDASINLQVRGDLVIGNAPNPGFNDVVTISSNNTTNATVSTQPSETGDGSSWFSLWTSSTSIDALSAGGNVVPVTASATFTTAFPPYNPYPPILRVFATGGSIYAGTLNPSPLELAPSSTGQLELLAEGSIYANALLNAPQHTASPEIFEISGANTGPNSLPNPFDPAWELFQPGTPQNGSPVIFPGATNTILPSGSSQGTFGLFAFEFDSATGTLHAQDPNPARIYAVTGDIVDLQVGQLQTVTFGSLISPFYIAGKAMDIRAGNDIVNFGESNSSRSLILNNSQSDVSVISAGNEILFANVDIAGPGNLELSAGGNVYQGAQGTIESIGLVGTPKISNPDGGAGIIVLAGVGSGGPNWTGFADLYLNPANVADPNQLLLDQPGKVVATYQDQLLTWLRQNYKFTGSSTEAVAYFKSLPVEQQSVFLLKIYFNELNLTGLEYNDPSSRFFHTYVRGNEAIATLFPNTGSNGQKITYNGSLTMFSSAPLDSKGAATLNGSILTDFGGGITTVVPGGQTIVGVTGVNPGAHAGILTQGSGDIDMYAGGSVLLGESRVLTTFGGNIVIWSATGDINAGIGAKGTVIFAPAGILYDEFADILLSPTVPSSGAGIGTLAPIPDVPPGDVNLIAPEGTIDAGEAGIRASGNANLAARVIVNAANISVAGKTTGIPTIVSPNVAAITAASNTVGATNNVAQEIAKQQTNAEQQQAAQSVIIVEVLGYGGGDSSSD